MICNANFFFIVILHSVCNCWFTFKNNFAKPWTFWFGACNDNAILKRERSCIPSIEISFYKFSIIVFLSNGVRIRVTLHVCWNGLCCRLSKSPMKKWSENCWLIHRSLQNHNSLWNKTMWKITWIPISFMGHTQNMYLNIS